MLKEILQAEGRGYLMESWIYTGTNATRNRLVNKFFLTFEITLKANGGGFPVGAVVKNPPANAGDMGSSPGPGRSHMPRSN